MPSLYDESPTTRSTAAVASSSLVLPEAFVEGRPSQEDKEVLITTNCSVTVNLIELSLHSGLSRDSLLATLQVRNLSIVSLSPFKFIRQRRRKHARLFLCIDVLVLYNFGLSFC